MRPVLSPYNAATGGVTSSTPPPVQAYPPPLLPCWCVTYTHASGESTVWLRAASVIDALAETRRLHPEMCTATVRPWIEPQSTRTGGES